MNYAKGISVINSGSYGDVVDEPRAVLQTSVAADKVYDLSFTTEYMDKHPTVKKAFLPWIKEINALTNGRVTITYFNPNTLALQRTPMTPPSAA